MSSVIDHVVVCMPDLTDSVVAFEADHGVVSVPGGRHRGHGTANRLVPLGDAYIELVAVVDTGEAEDSVFGRWVTARSSGSAADGIAIATDDLDSICGRLDLEPIAMSRPADTGDELRWRIAGMDQLVTSGLPFFIQWDIDPELHPGRIAVNHPRGDVKLGRVVVSGDLPRLQSWTGGTDGLELHEGDHEVRFELE
ncbi:MAG TPA: VOC family protein [Acidimicrobiia bacterium]